MRMVPMTNCLANPRPWPTFARMSHPDHVHESHDHVHGPGCGHTQVVHDGHIDFLHDGHLHHPHGDHVDEHVVAVDEAHPDRCDAAHECAGHEHGEGCGHETVPHGDHFDYLVDGRLHHPHDGHCDDHGPLQAA